MPSLDPSPPSSLKEYAENLATLFPSDVLDEYVDDIGRDYTKYQTDPVGFGEEVLGESYTDELKEILCSVRDNEITVARSCNAPGKTFVASTVAIWFKKAFPDSKVYTAAAPPIENLQRLLWGEINAKVQNHSNLFYSDKISNLHIESSPVSFITGVTIPTSGTSAQREARFSGKHAPNLLFVLDEGDAIPDEVYKGIESCLSGGGVVRLLILFNPRAEVGPVYRMERNNTAKVIHLSAFNHPNVMTGEDIFPGAVTRSKTIQRIHEWCRPWIEGDKFDQTFELPPYLVGQTASRTSGAGDYPPLKAGKYVIQNPAFSYMVLGEYPAQSSRQLISREWVSMARSRWDAYVAMHGEVPPEGSTAIVGMDVAEDGVDYNVVCFRYGGFVPRLIKWQGLRDILENADKAYAETKDKDVEYVAVEATGIGSGVAPQIRRNGGAAVPVKFASSSTCSVDEGDFRNLRDELYWKLRDWLHRDPGAMLPPDEDLLEEILTIQYDVFNGKIEMMPKSIRKDDERGKENTMKSLLKRSPDSLEALVCSFYVPELLFPELL